MERRRSGSVRVLITLMDSYFNPEVKELRDRQSGRVVGLISKDGDLYKASNYKKRGALFTSIEDAVSFVSETYKKGVSNEEIILEQLKIQL